MLWIQKIIFLLHSTYIWTLSIYSQIYSDWSNVEILPIQMMMVAAVIAIAAVIAAALIAIAAVIAAALIVIVMDVVRHQVDVQNAYLLYVTLIEYSHG